jgi:hypothetical protein
MSNFDPAVHPRENPTRKGIFTDRTYSEPEVGLHSSEPAARAENFDDVEVIIFGENEGRLYKLRGEKHRTDGHAIEVTSPTSVEGRYFLHNVEVFAPDEDLYLDSVNVDGDQDWSSPNGGRQARRYDDGRVTHWVDGDYHRAGGPALIAADGTERWFVRGREIDSPWPAEDTRTENIKADTKTRTGANYDEWSSAKEDAAKLREDIKAGIAAGTLDDIGISYDVEVSARKREDRPEIKIIASGLSRNRLKRENWLTDLDGNPSIFSDEALKIQRALERLGESYNSTTVHNGTDSIQSKFALNVRFEEDKRTGRGPVRKF